MLRKHYLLLLALMASSTEFFPTNGHAEIAVFESIECKASRSDIILTGTIESVTGISPPQSATSKRGNTRDGDILFKRVSLSNITILKGQKDAKKDFVYDNESYPLSIRQGDEALLFLKHASPQTVTYNFSPVPSQFYKTMVLIKARDAINLNANNQVDGEEFPLIRGLNALSKTGELLETREEVLNAIKNELKQSESCDSARLPLRHMKALPIFMYHGKHVPTNTSPKAGTPELEVPF